MDYNSQRKKMIIPEYGRCVQEMIDLTKTIEDRKKRNIAALEIIRQMASLQQSNIKDAAELDRKLWDHLYIISNFELDVDSPYPKPVIDHYVKPAKLKYNSEEKEMPFRYYGIIVNGMIQKAVLMDDGDEKNAFMHDIANNMKKLYLAWNKGAVDDKVIVEHLGVLSGGRLSLSDTVELSSNFNIPNPNNSVPVKVFKKKKKDFKQNFSNGGKKFYKKKSGN
jgi:hypothetical protein